MQKVIPALLIILFLTGCKKKNSNESEVTQEPVGTPSTLPPSTFKRVNSLKLIDSLSGNQITTSQYEYSFVTGNLIKETITDSFPGAMPPAYVSVKNFSYNTSGKIASFTTTAGTNTSVTSFLYDSITGKVTKKIQAYGTNSITVNYNHFGNSTTESEGGPSTSSSNYINGDLNSQTYYFQSSAFTSQYTYSSSLLDKSKLFFTQSSYLPAACKLLLSSYHPAGPANVNGPTTINYTYTFDIDGYPVSYKNNQGRKWTVTYIN